MECIRLLHANKYNKKQHKFTRPAFRNIAGGLSVIEWDCIRQSGKSVADHVRQYYQCYPGIVGEPPIFWKFDTSVTLPAGHVVQQVTSDSGDICHHDVKGLDDSVLWGVFETKDISDFSICTNGGYRQVTEAEILAQKT